MNTETVYTPRFVEDFVINKLKNHPELTNEQIAQEFLAQHGEKFDKYLRNVGAFVQSAFSKDISKLESEKEALKNELVLALKAKGILGDDEKSKIVINYVKGLEIHFVFKGSGIAQPGKNYVEIDWIQTYKFITDFPNKNLSLYLMAKGTVFHELAHMLSRFFGDITRKETGGSFEEKFAQGVSVLVMNYLGLTDVYTAYYKEKEKEIVGLGELRIKAGHAIGSIYTEAGKLGLDVLSIRCRNLACIYISVPSFSLGIEFYANPLSIAEIKAIVQSALSKFKTA